MKTAILALTDGGRDLAAVLVDRLTGSELLPVHSGIKEVLAENWNRYDAFVCIMATGIVVRAIAPLLGDKRTDPCVLVLDQAGEHVISLLSGHLGGGNRLAIEVASLIGARPVITTASDVLGLVALDLWADQQGLIPNSKERLTGACAALVNQGVLHIYSEPFIHSLPPGLRPVEDAGQAEVIVSCRTGWPDNVLTFHPRNLVAGIGCNRGTPSAEMESALEQLMAEHGLARVSVRNLATIDVKRDEPGLLDFAESNGWEIDFFTKDSLNAVEGLGRSDAVLRAVGAKGVAEPAALLSAGTDRLLVEKKKWRNVTLALAAANCTLSAQDREA